MATTIPQRALRNDNAAIIDAVTAGETFVVTRNGMPVAELRPLRPRPRRFVPKSEVAALLSSGASANAASLLADLDELLDQRLR